MKEALKLALDALMENEHYVAEHERHAYVVVYNKIIEKCKEALAAQPAQEPDYDTLSQKQLASLKRDTRISLEDAAVRATHKVMAELGEEHMKDEDDDIQVYQRPWVGLTHDERY